MTFSASIREGLRAVDGQGARRVALPNKDAQGFYPFCVGECWDGERTIDDWLNNVNALHRQPDPRLRFSAALPLKDLCDTYGFQPAHLAIPERLPNKSGAGGDLRRQPRHYSPIPAMPSWNDKLLAYSFILTHEGYPSVSRWTHTTLAWPRPEPPTGSPSWWRCTRSTPAGQPAALRRRQPVHHAALRFGRPERPGLRAQQSRRWLGWSVSADPVAESQLPGGRLGGHDNTQPEGKQSDAEGNADFWAAPRGWAVYVPV